MNDPEELETVHLDATNLRGVAHPVRVKMLGMLRSDGPATATSLAQRLGMNTGATSYHLRQLAEYGFVVEDPERGVGRERWWKAAHYSSNYSSEDHRVEPEDAETYVRAVAQTTAEQVLRSVDERATLPQEWRAAGTLSSYMLKLTPAELRELNEQVEAVIRSFRAALPEPVDAPEGSARVTVQYQAFPHTADLDFETDEQ
ncbi:ArsR/SmtB family transcription factor [Stackebrandtia nassauensis]|nr:winged helix-turn-helix domain-containing protein [Stackebrandtia nassauensis]